MRLPHLGLLLIATAAPACGGQQTPPAPTPTTAPSEASAVGQTPIETAAGDDRIGIEEPAVQAPVPPPIEVKAPIEALRLSAPPYGYHLTRPAPVTPQGPKPKLKKLSAVKNDITDDEAWFASNQLRLPVFETPVPATGAGGALPADMAERFSGMPIILAIDHGDHHIALYANDYSGGRKLIVTSPTGEVLGAFDFTDWGRGPKDKPSDAQFTEQGIVWAQMQSGVLYVSTGHRTYAASSGGLNAFLSAIDMQTGELLWQSDPLVANARNFLLRDGWIVTGYGFTAEPDFMYILDMKTGRKVSTTKVKSGPDYILEREGKIFVRTYNTNYEFSAR